MRVNQLGQPIEEEILDVEDLTLPELRQVVSRLISQLNLTVLRTNATQNGEFSIFLKPDEDES